jgi:predicted MFS family arabinose efflux permease
VAVPHLPLRRNRDFVLLQLGQLLSVTGMQMTAIAYPLLVLALTHSPAKAGIVGFARIVPYPLFGMLAGAAADRWDRKRLMIAADVVRAVTIASLVATIAADTVVFWQIVAVAFVEGAASSFFAAAQAGALRSVVPAPQMPAAVATVTARQSVVLVAGPPIGGALFTIGRAVPFAVDAVSYAFSTVSLLLMRTPFQEQRERSGTRLRAEIAEGLAYLWQQPFLRTCALLFGIGNLVFPGLSLVIVVVGTRQGLTGGEIGLITAVFGACLLVGSALSAFSRRTFSVRSILLMELWTWTGCAVFLIWPSVYVLAASILPTTLTIPSTDSVVHGYRTAMTPDRLIGRVDSAARTISLAVSPLGPLLAGLLLSATSARVTVAVFAAFGLLLALWGTLSTSIRNAPSLTELEKAPRRPVPDSA